ncbi:MAG: alanine--glyoxylate aminotransferase family protein [Pseudomonadales bacterium]|jgi:alanine-glyoxylate transaminase/serine-glyoxylate transaminase/serine-pyruvate transaminase|nr:alanine--glyoxylate aminotransferase family protein [Pseudomonadales bacterium]MDP6317313.1 alanine--glyoxylate aminotransferase family protein [Pseudomonadales bacterium]MDP7315448.1 alanine--glyoxylate aminotransferase family protein [Pseudomonadales bacterium]MDP7577135.1 alanine--glyoxylate aminotransferase family protein [Pseudomonadales bacterium]|tara:strand:+ start:9702 stop:10877 length:1176 start_codon:yes stop_codon:yes gene_type:complete
MYQSFNPTTRTLMGPGPSDVNPRILSAMGKPTIGHLDPEFIRLMDELKGLLQFAFRTRNELTIPISAPGSAGMETCFVNLVSPGDKVVVCQNGVFGSRMADNVRRLGGEAVIVEQEWGRAVDPEALQKALKANPGAKIVAFVHAETSTGARSDARQLCEIARQSDCLTIVDCVTSLAGCDVDIDGWGADAVYSGTQKCLSCAPGLSPVSFNERAVEVFKNRQTPVSSWFLDLNLVMGYWGEGQTRAYHHTAPVNALYGLHEALLILSEEGLEASWQRHTSNHLALRAGLEALGMSFIVPEPERLTQLNAVTIPEGVDEAAVRKQLLQQFNLEIGAGLGSLAGKVWRIGLMGYASNPKNVMLCVNALEAVLSQYNVHINRGEATAAVLAAYG